MEQLNNLKYINKTITEIKNNSVKLSNKPYFIFRIPHYEINRNKYKGKGRPKNTDYIWVDDRKI